MDVILHMGAHRCATTTLQTYLVGHAQALDNAGIALWTPLYTRSGLFGGLIARPEDLTDDLRRRSCRATGLIRIELARLRMSGTRQLIVSEENMLGAARNNLRQRQLYPLLDERLARFQVAFGDRCTRIGLAIRGYDSFWASALSFAVAAGHCFPDMATRDALAQQPRRWRDVVRDIAAAFPAAEIVVWPFEDMAARPERQLALLSGDAAPPLSPHLATPWRNASPGCDALRRALSLRGDAEAAEAIPAGKGRWMPFDDAQCQAMQAQYQVDLAWLAQGAGGLARLAAATNSQIPATTAVAPAPHSSDMSMAMLSGLPLAGQRAAAGGLDYGKRGYMG